jgi:sulfite dehydrogenase (cytochrome) subunit B
MTVALPRGSMHVKIVTEGPMRIVLAALGIIVATAGPARAADVVSITLPAETATLGSGAGADVAQTQCKMCHSLDYITTQPRGGAAQWEGVVTKMIKVFGAPISADDARIIAQYLTAHYGPR